MPALPTSLRKTLENTIKAARREAEAGAAAALAYLSVAEAEPGSHLSPEQRKLRTRLRAHAVQLGDGQKGKTFPALKRLEHEAAFEHWHRMLFARFLAENELLLEPGGMAISLAEAAELAAEEKLDLWAYAARCAQAMLPQVFRAEDPVLAMDLPRERRNALEALVQDLPVAVFTADDSLGWVYQFWRADEKYAVNKAGEKINADTLPAVTQLFTEHYMVEFLLHNTLGAWWTARNAATHRTSAIQLPYLRLKEDGSPAAGSFPGWPETVKELRTIDPSCGSGHILVALLQLLVAMRREEEGLSAEAAVRAVLLENLHGLEIDPRCSQLAAFNVAFTAWKIIGRPVELPPLHIACSGLAVGGTREEWLQAIDATGSDLRFFLGQLYDLFKKAPELGSLINPARLIGGSMHADRLEPLLKMLDAAFAREETAKRLLAPDEYERGVAAQGMARAAQLLAGNYHLVMTNVPYLGRGNQGEDLKKHIETHYPAGKADLSTAFVLRCLEFCVEGGASALVTPQNWLFLGSYKHLRQRLLEAVEWNVIGRLGPKAFQTPMWDFSVLLLVMTRTIPSDSHQFIGVDVADEATPSQKSEALYFRPLTLVSQGGQRQNPDSRIGLTEPSTLPLLRTRAVCVAGVLNGDSPRFIRTISEVACFGTDWTGLQSTVDTTRHFGGREQIILWENGKGQLRSLAKELKERLHDADTRGNQVWGKWGVAVSQMGRIPVTLYSGEKFDSNVAVISPTHPDDLSAIWTFASSPEFQTAVRAVDQKLNVTNATLAKIPFDLAHWQKIAAEKYPHGLPRPHSDDPTQWLFSGHPRGATEPLQVAVARLLGYRWPRQTGYEFPDCPALGPDGLEALADKDGIVCLSMMQGEAPAAERLQQLLAAAYGEDWSSERLESLLEAAGYGHKSLEEWLRDKFFEQHCERFHQRPFVWQIWDGLPRGFSALVNYHRLVAPAGEGRKVLEKLTYTYLGDWIARQNEGVRNGAGGADDRLAAALELKKRLVAILEGNPPFDIFVRWKPLQEQPLGWEPDVNDGVRVNIRPFMASDLPSGKRGAGILRNKPGVKWEKDRGKEPRRLREEFPWFWGWDGKTEDFTGGDSFTGERWNDCHYSIQAKRAARGQPSQPTP